MKLTAKNWDQFQHYKNRQPPWIKLHRNVINSFSWTRLQTASKALAPCLWMLASESMDGTIVAEVKELAWKFGMSERDVRDGIEGLVNADFFALTDEHNTIISNNNISTENRERDREESALATRLQNASKLLARGVNARIAKSDPDFDVFWAEYPRKTAKEAARKAWASARARVGAETILNGLRAAVWPAETQFIPHPSTWLNQGRWDDQPPPTRPRDEDMIPL